MARGTFPQVFCCLVAAVFAVTGAVSVLPPPENVRIVSENLGLQLLWNPPKNITHTYTPVTYTTQYKSWDGSFYTVCVNQSETSCDVTSKISAFGSYELRVRAELQGLVSDWVKTDAFVVNDKTNISAPIVKLVSRKGDMEVQITDPVMRINDFQEIYRPVTYVITYWRKGHTHRVVQESEQSLVIVPASALSAEGSYCVQVHIYMRYQNRTTGTSNHTCTDISPDDKIVWWQIMLVMLGSFLTVAVGLLLLFGVGFYSYRCLRYIHPKARLPDHFFTQYSLYQMEQTKVQPVELCHDLSIIMEATQLPLVDGGSHCSSHTQPLLPEDKMEGGEEERGGGGGERTGTYATDLDSSSSQL